MVDREQAGPDSDISGIRLAGILDTAVDAIIIADASGRILTYNAACESLFGYTAEEALGRNVSMLMAEPHASSHDGYMKHYIETGERKIIGIGREVPARNRDGTVFPVELSVGEARTPEGRQFIGILRDLRPRYEAQRRLDDLQDQLVHMARFSAIDEMGATLAHELNQPLTAITLYLDALKRVSGKPEADADRTRSIVDKTIREAERAGAIIRRLRKFVERGEIERHDADLRVVIDDALALAAIGSRSLGIEIAVDPRPEPVLVSVDPIQIQQIIVNLVRNAIDAMTESGIGHRVTIGCSQEKGAAVLSVDDDGPGVAQDMRGGLFKAFVTSKSSGLGIGLAIAQSIAQNHSGELQLVEAGPGAHFRLRLPLAASTDGDRE